MDTDNYQRHCDECAEFVCFSLIFIYDIIILALP